MTNTHTDRLARLERKVRLQQHVGLIVILIACMSALIAAARPQNDQAISKLIRANRIEIVADGKIRPGIVLCADEMSGMISIESPDMKGKMTLATYSDKETVGSTTMTFLTDRGLMLINGEQVISELDEKRSWELGKDGPTPFLDIYGPSGKVRVDCNTVLTRGVGKK